MTHQEINPELRARLKDPVQEYISIIEEQDGGEIPIRTIYVPKEQNDFPSSIVNLREINSIRDLSSVNRGEMFLKEKHVPYFLNKHLAYSDQAKTVFSDAAHWLADSGTGYATDSDESVESYIEDFASLSSSVMHHTGDYKFTERAYNRVFDLRMKFDYGIHSWHKNIIPLPSFDMEAKNLQLSSDLDIVDYDDKTSSVTKIQISPIKIEELAGLYTWGYNDLPASRSSGEFGEDWTHVIRIEFEGLCNTDLGSAIAEMIVTALRLFRPMKTEVSVGDRFEIYPDGLSYREDIEGSGPLFYEGELINKSPVETYTLSSEGQKEFVDFWDTYADYIFTGNERGLFREDDTQSDSHKYETKLNSISQPLRRFNQVYRKERMEDAIIDTIIGFEGTLLKDVRHSRLSDRGVVLLEDDRYDASFIHEFLNRLYTIRNEIVHRDSPLENMEIDGKRLESNDVVKHARYFLAKTILRYIDLLKRNPDKNMTQINQKIIQPEIAKRLTE